MTVTATIIEVHPDTQYQGTTYQNRVVLDVQGKVFGVFDPDMRADLSMVGEIHEVDILPFLPTDVNISSDSTVKIEPNIRNPKEYLDHKFCGKISNLRQGWPKQITVNIGSGTVQIEFYTNASSSALYKNTVEGAKVGDMICATVSRTDLLSIE